MSQTFSGTQSAGNGNYPNNTGTSSNLSFLTFKNSSDAGTATIDNPTYNYTIFQGFSSANGASITLNGGSVYFQGFSTAFSASLVDFNASSDIAFSDHSSAGNASINLAVAGANLSFFNNSDGGTAVINSVAGSSVNFDETEGANNDGVIDIGQINGGATFYLGNVNLVLNGGVSTVSGHITGLNYNNTQVPYAAALSVQNGAQLIVTGSLDDIGTTDIDSASTVQFGDGVATGAVNGSGSFSNDGNIVFNEPANYSVGSDILGSGSVLKAGPGVLTLSGHVTNDIDLEAGTLELAAPSAYDNGGALINFVGATPAEVIFDQPTSSATVNGFALGDTIDVENMPNAVATKYLNNDLIFQDARGNDLASVHLPGNFIDDTFAFSHDANNGAQVTLQPLAHHVITDLTSANDIYVYLLYQAAFDRIPDEAGLRYNADLVDHHHFSINKLSRDFIHSPEFVGTYGHPSNANFVTELYNNVLQRSPDPSGDANYVHALDHHRLTRAQVLTSFAESQENTQLHASHITNGFWVT